MLALGCAGAGAAQALEGVLNEGEGELRSGRLEMTVAVMILRSILGVELKLAVHHIEAGQAHVAQQVVIKAQQMLALGSAHAHAAKALEGVHNEREGVTSGRWERAMLIMILFPRFVLCFDDAVNRRFTLKPA